jgi:hypothetical protein
MEESHAAAHAVLFSLDLWFETWPWLNASTIAALRGVCSAMRRQVDGSIVVVASPGTGFSADELTAALRRWPRTRDLTLLGVRNASTLQPLSTASVSLTSLTVREVGLIDRARPWPKRRPASAHTPHASSCRMRTHGPHPSHLQGPCIVACRAST